MVLFLLQRGTPHVEILIAVTLGVFLALWGMIALFTWMKQRPSGHLPESSGELDSTGENESSGPSGDDRSFMDDRSSLSIRPHRA